MKEALLNINAILITLLSIFLLFHKKVRRSAVWHATVTPLASIIGSGFLVSAPLLIMTSGRWATLIMTGIVIAAYSVGASIRFNIKYVEPLLLQSHENFWIYRIERISRPILSLAYVISVAFYLKILSAFTFRYAGIENIIYEKALTSIILLFIGVMGKLRGLTMLEFLEVYSVNTKLSIIFALIMTAFFYNIELLAQHEWFITAKAHGTVWTNFCKILGMLIIVQGFETSRYLGHAYNTTMRITTMRYAQWISGAIYIVFIAFTSAIFTDLTHITETAIIDMCKIIAPVLPGLLIVAAILSQFSAAVADTVGSGGLLTEATSRKLSVNTSYLLITSIAILLTWLTNIYQIISIASKAFAMYYALQILLSLISIKQSNLTHKKAKLIFYCALFILMVLVVFLGIPAG